MTTNSDQQDDVPWWAIELGCWTMVVLAPILTWVNGPAVSTDQAVVRGTVFVLAVLGGVGTTTRRLLRQRQG